MNKIRGMIYLWITVDGNEILLDKNWYISYEHRQRIIDCWFEKYSDKINLCFISIRPKEIEDDIEKVETSNVPVKRQPSLQKKIIKAKEPVPFVRPKAIYDNNKSLYGLNYDQ